MSDNRVVTFKSRKERDTHLEGVALAYLSAVVEGRIPFTEDRYRCAVVMLGYLKHGKDQTEVHMEEKAIQPTDPEVLLDKEVAGATPDGPETGQ